MNFRNAKYSMKKIKKTLENVVPFTTGNLRKIMPKFFGPLEGAQTNKQTNKQTKNPVGQIIFGPVHTALEKLGK